MFYVEVMGSKIKLKYLGDGVYKAVDGDLSVSIAGNDIYKGSSLSEDDITWVETYDDIAGRANQFRLKAEVKPYVNKITDVIEFQIIEDLEHYCGCEDEKCNCGPTCMCECFCIDPGIIYEQLCDRDHIDYCDGDFKCWIDLNDDGQYWITKLKTFLPEDVIKRNKLAIAFYQ